MMGRAGPAWAGLGRSLLHRRLFCSQNRLSHLTFPGPIPNVKAKLRTALCGLLPWLADGNRRIPFTSTSVGAGGTLVCLFLGSLLQNKQILTLLWVDGLPRFWQPRRFFKTRRRDTEKSANIVMT